MNGINPHTTLAQLAKALPENLHSKFIIVGSLSAAATYFDSEEPPLLMTKDVDFMFSPKATAMTAARDAANQLIGAGWVLNNEGAFTEPGTQDTRDEDLPIIRLRPDKASSWFIELSCAPAPNAGQLPPPDSLKRFDRVQTSLGHFGLHSFEFLSLTQWNPLTTAWGIQLARPEMMASSNALHHQIISPATIRGMYHQTTAIKRSNKDLGRIVALTFLQMDIELCRRSSIVTGLSSLDDWPTNIWDALVKHYHSAAPDLAKRVGQGVRALIASPDDMNQALWIASNGLLADYRVSHEEFKATASRFVRDVAEKVEQLALGHFQKPPL